MLVYRRGVDGAVVMTHDIDTPIKTRRSPTQDDVYQLASVLVKDIEAGQAAGMAVQGFVQVLNAQAQAAVQNQQGESIEDLLRNLEKERRG
jgi:hypothetical protein